VSRGRPVAAHNESAAAAIDRSGNSPGSALLVLFTNTWARLSSTRLTNSQSWIEIRVAKPGLTCIGSGLPRWVAIAFNVCHATKHGRQLPILRARANTVTVNHRIPLLTQPL
jgi:hypothetical protein